MKINAAQIALIVAAVVTALEAQDKPVTARNIKARLAAHRKAAARFPLRKATKPSKPVKSDPVRPIVFNNQRNDAQRSNEKAIKNEVAVVAAFLKAGFTDISPRKNVLSFNGWDVAGFRPRPKTGVFVKGVGTLFHVSSVVKKIGASDTAKAI